MGDRHGRKWSGRVRSWIGGAGATLLLAGPVLAQGRGEIELPRLSGPVRVDGVVDESAWRAVTPLPLTMYGPTFRGTPGESSTIWVAYDEENLYAAGQFHDSRPGEIRINSLYRDRWSGDDAFALLIDPFNDNETGLWFLTNPAGVRIDQSISADGGSYNESWNAFWDVATQVTADGWSAEMRIPLSSVRFQERDGRVVMGLTVTRLVARTNERVTFPAIDPRFGFRQPSVMQDVVLRRVSARRPVYLTPYLLSGVDRATALQPGGAAYGSAQSVLGELGGDLKYGLSDNLNLDLSLNTDFAQVEADDEQINLTRFPLFFPEKRQFFQERSGVFDFDFKSGGRLFHSRQIGLAPDRTPIRMLGGARVVARAGAWDVGVLNVQTARRGALPSENLGVARVRRRLLNQFSYAGGILTSRIDQHGGYNVGAGLDASLRLFGNDYLTVRGATTFDPAQASPNLAARGQVFLEWQRRSTRGLTYFAQFHRAGADYRPELGFLPRRDFSRSSVYAQYEYHLKGNGTLRSHGPGAISNLFFRNADREIESSYLAYWWIYEFRTGAQGWLEVIHHYEDVTEPFDLGDSVLVLPGGHKFATVWFNFQAPTGPLLRTGVDAQVGGFYDGWQAQVTIDPTWNLSRHLEIGGSYQFNHIRFPARHTGLDAHVGRLRVGAAANARLSAVAVIQLNSVSDRVGVNLRLRYNYREGTDLWLVYDEGFSSDRDPGPAGAPRLPLSMARALRLKFTHTFVL